MSKISSRTHPDQNKWFKENTLHIYWDLKEGVEYSFILTKDFLAEPDNIPDRLEGKLKWAGGIEYSELEDGIYYFHLKQKIPGEDWSSKTTFQVMIDKTPPKQFTPKLSKETATFGEKYFLAFTATDEMSGIDYFEVLEGSLQKQWKRAENPYLLQNQNLKDKILVKAVDKAGNERIVKILKPLYQPDSKKFLDSF